MRTSGGFGGGNYGQGRFGGQTIPKKWWPWVLIRTLWYKKARAV